MKKFVAESLPMFEEAVEQSKKEKADQAITGLKKQLADAKKKGAFKTTVEKNAKIKDLEGKIAKWEEKKKD